MGINGVKTKKGLSLCGIKDGIADRTAFSLDLLVRLYYVLFLGLLGSW